jgi:hypothetical protein
MGQKHYFLLVTAPQITLETLLPLLFRQFLEEVFSETRKFKGHEEGSGLNTPAGIGLNEVC